jgi:hypothetical protein
MKSEAIMEANANVWFSNIFKTGVPAVLKLCCRGVPKSQGGHN